MEIIKARNKIIIVIILLAASAITQCAPKPQIIKEDDEAVLRGRVQEYWSYRINGAWDKSYLYESPDYRERISITRYINQYGRSVVKWEGFDILEIWTSGEEGHVKLNTNYRYRIPQTAKAAFKKAVEEQWIKIEGRWYRLSSSM